MADYAVEMLAEDALLLRFGEGIDRATNARVHAAASALRDAGLPGITDIAPAYATLLLRFDPLEWDGNAVREATVRILGDSPRQRLALRAIGYAKVRSGTLPPPSGLRRDDEQGGDASGRGSARLVEIPVCYGGECGPDIDAVAEHARLSRDAVAARHAAAEYTVAMLGFAPGFPYLLGLDAALQVPRRATPRTRVPPGSVAIGGAQTGIYPRELPGGWHLIGRTPLVLFDPQREPPCLLAPGDRVRFRPIGAQEFAPLAERDT
jgi:KipI family sensor histidine kinase inhibitor